MQICFFVPRCTPDNSHGRYVVELAKRLGIEHVLTVYSGAFWPQLRSLVTCRFLPIPVRPAVLRLASLWVTSAVAMKRRSADIVHVQGADAPVGNIVTAHFCNQVMRNTTNHGVGLRRRLNYSIGAVAEKYCMSKSSTIRVIAVSQTLKNEIEREYGVDPRRVVVIHHGVDAELFHPRNRSQWFALVRSRLGLKTGHFVVLFVGGEYRRKGLVPLLEAVARVPGEVKVLAVGVSPDRTLAQFIRRRGLDNLVIFLDHTDDVESYYAAADCFALPTQYDTFSMATLEAMASGLPVIVSRAAGVTELLRPGYDCLITEEPEDVDLLSQYLVQLASDHSLRRRLGAEARKTAEKHSWDVVAQRTEAVYRQVLASPQ